jgi:hypothetical protein
MILVLYSIGTLDFGAYIHRRYSESGLGNADLDGFGTLQGLLGTSDQLQQ